MLARSASPVVTLGESTLARSMACSMFSVVTTPKVTGTPVCRLTCAMPLAASLHTRS